MEKVEKIKKILKEQKDELRKKYEIKEIGIFGSYLKKEQKQDSDFDILIDFEPNSGVDLLKFINLENYLSDLLGIKVDLVMKSALKPRIGKHILKNVVYL
ncbi:nucleotidyltransferase family protein [Patescibacteria group bacterium]|nr:nucleotidyltransferase family protein [Patescibacteria group bacterium]